MPSRRARGETLEEVDRTFSPFVTRDEERHRGAAPRRQLKPGGAPRFVKASAHAKEVELSDEQIQLVGAPRAVVNEQLERAEP